MFEHNTKLGVASVIPWRRQNRYEPKPHGHDHLTHDRHGIPRCKHCGVRFNKKTARLGFRCVRGATPACKKEQTLTCATDWRLLLPLWRTDPIYGELAEAHEEYEGVHQYWRSRYKVASQDSSSRPRRRCLAWQELRASGAPRRVDVHRLP